VDNEQRIRKFSVPSAIRMKPRLGWGAFRPRRGTPKTEAPGQRLCTAHAVCAGTRGRQSWTASLPRRHEQSHPWQSCWRKTPPAMALR